MCFVFNVYFRGTSVLKAINRVTGRFDQQIFKPSPTLESPGKRHRVGETRTANVQQITPRVHENETME